MHSSIHIPNYIVIFTLLSPSFKLHYLLCSVLKVVIYLFLLQIKKKIENIYICYIIQRKESYICGESFKSESISNTNLQDKMLWHTPSLVNGANICIVQVQCVYIYEREDVAGYTVRVSPLKLAWAILDWYNLVFLDQQSHPCWEFGFVWKFFF